MVCYELWICFFCLYQYWHQHQHYTYQQWQYGCIITPFSSGSSICTSIIPAVAILITCNSRYVTLGHNPLISIISAVAISLLLYHTSLAVYSTHCWFICSSNTTYQVQLGQATDHQTYIRELLLFDQLVLCYWQQQALHLQQLLYLPVPRGM